VRLLGWKIGGDGGGGGDVDDDDNAFRKISPALHLWHIISKICIIAIFVIVDSQRIFNKEFVGTFMIHLHSTFCIPSCNFPFVITSEVEYRHSVVIVKICCYM
jgi:hypothetical protein